MVGRTMDIDSIITKDRLATKIAENWIDFDSKRQLKKNDWEEVRRYVYATDTSHTSNSALPWKNKTTIPKLCQIRDNLYANYTATLFPQRKWLIWEANEKDSNSIAKRNSIVNYTSWMISQPSFKNEVYKVILDYIDYGNCFATVEWVDERTEQPNRVQTGYVGPAIRRINPLDLVMNPVADNFENSPKIIRSLVSMGEVKEILERLSNDENHEEYLKLWDYMKHLRKSAQEFSGEWVQKDNLFNIDGFTSFRDYLTSDTVELLTFYGDLYDIEKDELLKNHVITVVDRHKVIGSKPNPSFFGNPPIFHSSWRMRQDNLWGMGPLDNLVGMQYRIDHIENMKADIWDAVTYPVVKIKGFVEDFTWQPGEKIYTSEEGDVDLVQPNVQIMQANTENQYLAAVMEEMAGAPKEAMGFRTPGEKTKYEVQRLENAAARVFQNKIKQFEEAIIEPILNAMIELARRNMSGINSIKVFDDEFNEASFQTLTAEDITGVGRIKPIAARHFAEQAELIQNLNGLASSGAIWQTIAPHISGVRLAKIFDEAFNLQDYQVIIPYIALAEQADAQRQSQALQEHVLNATSTASGIGEDYDLEQQMGMDSMQQAPNQGVI